MRDYLCKEEILIDVIENNQEELAEYSEEILALQKDIENGIQRYPKKNSEIILSNYKWQFQLIFKLIKAKYSLGVQCSELESIYLEGIDIIDKIGCKGMGYVNFIQYFSLGILLEVSIDKLSVLVEVADNEELDDNLFDCFVSVCGLNRKVCSTKYQKENPYSETKEIIVKANVNNEQASLMLSDYIENKWLKGHADFEWTTAHKRAGYVGLWSFEAAAIAKIFSLDDSKLKEDNHYPYDLVHYKNNMMFNKEINISKEHIDEKTQIDKYIPENPELEQIIPNEFRDEINQLLVDFSTLTDEDFWEKYNLIELWYTVDEYKKHKSDEVIIGNILVNQLVSLGYILQLDYKEEIDNFADNIKNYWENSDTKLVRFELDNDQNYYARILVSTKIKNIYEVNIYECGYKEKKR